MTVPTPIHHWSLNETVGNYADSIASDNGVPTAITRVPGIFSNAIQPTGTTSRVSITSRPTDLNFQGGNWSVSCWFKTAATPANYQCLYSYAWGFGGVWIGLETGTTYPDVWADTGAAVNVLSGASLFPVALSTGDWYQITVTKSGTVWRCYINNALVMENLSGPSTLATGAGYDPLIGNSETNQWFQGEIDNVIVWNQALTASEVGELNYTPIPTLSLANQDPAPYELYATATTSVDFDVQDSTHQALESSLEITIDGILAYDGDGGDFQPGYTGTVITVGNNIECSITKTSGFDYSLSGHSVRVYCENDAAQNMDETYYFGTVQTTAGIYPVAPAASSAQFEDENTAITIDFLRDTPTQVRVDRGSGWEIVWNGLFQAPWSGVYIAVPTQNFWRLILDADVAYTIGQVVRVEATNDNALTTTYSFRVASRQHTTTNDVTSPQIIEAATFIHAGYSRSNDGAGLPPTNFDGPGNIYMLTVSPATGETLVVPGNEIALVYDPTLGKVIVYFVRNGTVFYMTMDPSDVASTQSVPRSLESLYRLGVGGEGQWQHWEEASFPPIKHPEFETMDFGAGGEGGWISFYNSPHNSAPAPQIISGPLNENTIELRIEQPTTSRERELILGYFIVKWTNRTPNEVGYAPITPTDLYTVWTDPVSQPGVSYSVVPYFRRIEGHSGTIKGITGPRAELLPNAIRDVLTYGIGGEGRYQLWEEESIPPLKQSIADTLSVGVGSAGSWLFWEDSSFRPIGT